jgi:hypothetical protein
MEQLKTLTIGASGITASSVSPELMQIIAHDAPAIIQVLVQIAIGVVTLLGLFKRNKKVNP